MKRLLSSLALGVVVSLLGAPAHAITIVLPRAGQVGIGVQGQFGGLANSGELGEEFGTGPGLAVRVKYRMRYDRAIGLSFEERSLDTRRPRIDQTAFLAEEDSIPREKLKLNTEAVDLYQFFGTRTRTPKYVSASLGISQITSKLKDGETQFPISGDAFFLGVGAGFERFVYRSWAVDVSGRYSAIFLDGTTNNDVQLAVGMTFYAAY